MPRPQTAASHAAFDTLTHFVLGPIFLINFVVAVVVAVRGRHHLALHLWLVVIAVALFLMALKMRLYALRVQDRLIRLEERLRIAALAPQADVSRLSMAQFIALRFASDAELPALVARTLAENLDPKAIKSSIQAWRPDYARV
ncbi:MAG TPA: DUF6526 family protein [Acidobacteriaceae bacterium]|jgi:hypothetical protein|nr:DUF6526 family protein [Acidobacteriaceae bacterium]